MRVIVTVLFFCTFASQSFAIDPRVEVGRNLNVLFMCKDKGKDYLLAPVCDAVNWLMTLNDPKSWDSLQTLYSSNKPENKRDALARCSGLFHMIAQQSASARCKGLISTSNSDGIVFLKSAIDLEWAAAAKHATSQNMSLNPNVLLDIMEDEISKRIETNSAAYSERLVYEYSIEGTLLDSDKFMEKEMIRCLKISADWKGYPEKELGININIK